MKNLVISIITTAAFSIAANAQNVNIPDANFKAYLVGNTSINTNMDSEIQVSEAAAFTGQIGCSNLGITNLTGIEAFTNLTALQCIQNNLGGIDISQNVALTTLNCMLTNLSALDVSHNTALVNLLCNDNNISSLDITQNTNLSNLKVQNNSLNSLNISQNPNLIYFSCAGNNLTTLNLSQNTNLTYAHCFDNNLEELNMKNLSTNTLTTFDATSNPNLSCIEVDNVALANANWTNIDAASNFSFDCSTLVTSITVQGQGGASTITTLAGTLQMQATVLPIDADNNTYTWSVINGTGSASISTLGLLTAIADGDVTVKATANDASGISGSTIITISNQSLAVSDQLASPKLILYPMPVSSELNVASERPITKITIIDMMGRTIKKIDTPSQLVDVSELTKGIYFFQAQIDNQMVIKRFVKD